MPAAAAHGMMFFDLGAVIDGHFPAGKIHDLAAHADMLVEQRGVIAHDVETLRNLGLWKTEIGRSQSAIHAATLPSR